VDQLSQIAGSLDMLDLVLAVFGALIVSMWWGRGKSVWGILGGAAMGGLVKPLFFTIFLGGTLIAVSQQPEIKQTPEQVNKTLKFWQQ
jgi:hypothetical protein